MKHIWINDNNPLNTEVYFEYQNNKQIDELVLSIAPFYTVFFDNKVVSYGPERTAAGYSRIRKLNVPKEVKTIVIRVTSHGFPSYDCDFQDPFFGCDVIKDEKVIDDCTSFRSFKSNRKVQDSEKYTFQRGFVEIYDLKNVEYYDVVKKEVSSPIILENGVGDTCLYKHQEFIRKDKHEFTTFDEIASQWFKKSPLISPVVKFEINEEYLSRFINNGSTCHEFELEVEKTGLLKFEVEAKEDDTEVLVTFNECLPDGKWIFARGACIDVVILKLNKGKNTIITSVPYTLKYLRAISKKEIEITPSMILIQNDRVERKIISKDAKIQKIYDAALNTFIQNAVDVFTDCPGRERAGWLCDSYFTGIGEHYFTGKNDIERCFLENFILSKTEEIEEKMLPMTFPSQCFDKTYIPNWAMWFVLEVDRYYKETNDKSLVDLAKSKIMDLLDFFKEFENEEGLLENLRSWVFVEWSISNSPDYLKCISFPTNMLYSKMLETVSRLYEMPEIKAKADKVKEAVNKYSYNGKYYCDNAIRVDGVITPCRDHVSETCQYYALFFEMNNNKEYSNRILNDFSPKIVENIDNVGKSNVFIGYFLRFLWLDKIKEYRKIEEESKDYFYNMAIKTGTLWEKDQPNASCNHGFTCSIAALLAKAANN